MTNKTIGMIASHSALDLADGATEEGFKTIAICQKGREKTYQRYKRIINKTIVLDQFKDLMNIQDRLNEENIIFIPNRSLTAYIPYKLIEDKFQVPVFGNKFMLKADDERLLQFELFDKAKISHPLLIKSYTHIDRLCIVKVHDNGKKIERAFFLCSSPGEFLEKWVSREKVNILSETQMMSVWVEEYIIGAYFNFNYFYSPLKKEVEFLGVDRRIQTNIDGILHLPAEEQLNRSLITQNIEVGHIGATIRESLLEKIYEIGDNFVEASKKMYPPGIIGPFALQGVITSDLEIKIYDLSPRMQGSPVLYSSPYTKYYYGYPVTSGRRIAMEIKEAIKTNELDKLIT